MRLKLKYGLRPVQASWRERGRRGWHCWFHIFIGYFEFSINNGSLQDWSHFRIHRREYETHVVAGRFSIHFGRPGLEPVLVCAHCSELIEIKSAGDESWNYCEGCHQIEGDTEYITTREYEEANQ